MTMERLGQDGFVATGKHIELVQLVALRGRLKMELRGIKFRGGSTFTKVRNKYGLKGSREAVYASFCRIVDQRKAEIAMEDDHEVAT